MEFIILGPLEVRSRGSPVNLGGRQRRTLLAILIVHSAQSVSTDRIIDELWGDSAPSSARKTVQAHVAHLRKALNVDAEILSPASDGYRIDVEPDAIDAHRFENLVDQARSLRAASPSEAARLLDQALDLSKGTPLAGLADDAFSLRVEASRLEEIRLGAIEEKLDALIASGEAATVATEAERLVAEHPLRERLWGILMLAQYRTGRQADALRSFSRLRSVLAEEMGIEPSAELHRLEQRILDQDPALSEIGLSMPDVQDRRPAVVRNPFKGLRAFDEADTGDFFGRDALVRRLEERISSRSNGRLTVLAGPSGAGKSSVVRAGLIPRLRDNREVALMFPGDDPFSSLRQAIAEIRGATSSDALEDILSPSSELGHLVVVIDQFEELFTQSVAANTSQSLLDLVADTSLSVQWIITIRADFLDRLLSHPHLGGQLDESMILIPPLQEHEIRAVVGAPALRVGVTVDPDLVTAVVNEVSTRLPALPLLQYSLTDAFERRKGDSLSLEDYERAGGISGALARRAEELFESLSPEQQSMTQSLFLTLVTVTEEGEHVRRRVDRVDLAPGSNGQVANRLIDRFGAIRLLAFDQDPEAGYPTVEVAHEALFAEWPRLADWIDEARDDLSTQRRLSLAIAEWEESGRDPGFLLSGARLVQVEAWASKRDVQATSLEQSYIDAGRRHRDSDARRRTTRRRWMLGGAAAAVLVSAVLGSVALTNRRAAAEAARIGSASDLANASSAALESDPDLAVLLALGAVKATYSFDGFVLQSAEEALHRAIQSHRLLLTRPAGGAAFFSPDGSRFTGGGGEDIMVWDTDSGEHVLTLEGHGDLVYNVVWSPDGSLVASNSQDGTTRVWDAATGDETWKLEFGTPPVSVAISPDSTLLAVSCCREGPGWVRVWDIMAREEVPGFDGDYQVEGAAGVNFGPGGMLAVASGSGTVNIWDALTGQRVTDPMELGAIDVAFSADGGFLAVAGDTSMIVDTSTWEITHRLFGHTDDADAIDVDLVGSRIVTGALDGRARIYDGATSEPLMTLSGHNGAIINVAFSGDGRRVATADPDDVIRIWDTSPAGGVESLVADVGPGDVDYSPDGSLIASSGGGRLWLIETVSGEQLPIEHDEADILLRLKFAPDGSSVAAATFTGAIPIWDSVTGKQQQRLNPAATGPGWGGVNSVAYSPSGDLLAWAEQSGGVHVHDLESDTEVLSLPWTNVAWVEYSPDGETLATSGFDGQIRLVRAEDGTLIWAQQGHGGFDPTSLMVTFDPSGELLASIGFDGLIKLWDVATGEEIKTLGTGASGELWSVDFSPDGSRLATAGGDGTISVWHVDSGRRTTIAKNDRGVVAVEFSPSGDHLAAGDLADDIFDPGSLRVYVVDIDQLIALGESKLTRWWTPEECVAFLNTDTCPPMPGT